MPLTFDYEYVSEEKLKCLEEVKKEEQSFAVFHVEVTKDDCEFDNDSCYCALLDEAKEKLDVKGVLWDPQPQT